MPRRTSNTNDLYYITLTIVDWIDLFTRVEYKGLIIENLKHCQERKNLELYAYVLMTNHLHMICSCRKHPLSDILRDFKTFTSKELMKMIIDLPMESRRDWLVKSLRGAGKKSPQNKNFKIWQRGNYPFLLYRIK